MKKLALILALLFFFSSVFPQSRHPSRRKQRRPRRVVEEPSAIDSVPDWQLATSRNADPALYFYPNVTYARLGILHVWIKIQPLSERERVRELQMLAQHFDTFDFSKFDHFISLEEYDCTRRRARVLKVYYYDQQGEAITSLDKEEAGEWKDIIPDTPDNVVAETICR